jgi:glycosyltransferase involved in cell wall biosynthesis
MFRAAGAEVLTINDAPGSLAEVWSGLTELVAREKPDVVHAHMSESAILAAALNWRIGIPFVQTHQDGTRLVPDMPIIKTFLRRRALRLSAARAAAHIAVIPQLLDLIQAELSVPVAKCHYVPNSVMLQPPAVIEQAVAARRAGAARGEFRILALGRYVPLKGFAQLVAAAPALVAQFPGLRIDIVGSGPLEGELKAQAEALGVGVQVAIAGPTDKPGDYLRAAHVYVSTSEYEGMSLALLEAMAWRLPIVVSQVPGNRDMIADGQTGLHYPFGDVPALAVAIGGLLRSAETADMLAAEALNDAINQYSAEASLAQHAKLYLQAAGQR